MRDVGCNVPCKVLGAYDVAADGKLDTSIAHLTDVLPYRSNANKTRYRHLVENVACVLDVEVESSSKAVMEESSVNADTRCECLLPCEVFVANLRDECARHFVVCSTYRVERIRRI